MNRRHLMTMTRPAAAVMLGLGAIAATACGPTAAQAPSTGSPVATVATQPVTPPAAVPAAAPASALQAPAATPVAVNCGAGQQALIRPLLLDGQLVSQVDCVAVPGRVAGVAAAAPVAPPVEMVPAMASMDDDPRISAPAPRPRARTASYRTADYEPEVYREPVRKSGRSWQKSAIIIGSSAGVGAGVGAAVGGKKGALIGAAIGGGSATIWDQTTRRK